MTSSSRAHSAVDKAKREGLLVPQPCEECGSLSSIEAHHDDYSQPLVVRWLCRRHHALHHARVGPAPMPLDEKPMVSLRIDSATLDALRRMARLNDRNVSREMRRALRAYVEAQAQEATK